MFPLRMAGAKDPCRLVVGGRVGCIAPSEVAGSPRQQRACRLPPPDNWSKIVAERRPDCRRRCSSFQRAGGRALTCSCLHHRPRHGRRYCLRTLIISCTFSAISACSSGFLQPPSSRTNNVAYVTIRHRMEIHSLRSCSPILLGNVTVLTNSMSRYTRTTHRLDFAIVPVTAAVHLSLTAGASDSSFCTACPIATYSSSSGEFARRARLDSERRHSLNPSLKGTLLQPLGRQTPTTLVCVCVGCVCMWAGLVYGSSRERPI
jgi:hypothetical protein